MRELNNRIKNIEIPERMRNLPIEERGYPVPKFVPDVDGKPEFRGMDGQHLQRCVRHMRCWLCGEVLGKYMTFVIGPMCAVNRNSAEPPCHYDCANYAVRACPFLTQPRMRRNEVDMPEGGTVAGIGIKRNPGVTLLWITKKYRVHNTPQGPLFNIGDPYRLEFWAEGRSATLVEVLASIHSGLPILEDIARKEGPEALKQLGDMVADAMKLVNGAALA
jgi:hypothetical protein